jgi:hypothetical protein
VVAELEGIGGGKVAGAFLVSVCSAFFLSIVSPSTHITPPPVVCSDMSLLPSFCASGFALSSRESCREKVRE